LCANAQQNRSALRAAYQDICNKTAAAARGTIDRAAWRRTGMKGETGRISRCAAHRSSENAKQRQRRLWATARGEAQYEE